MQKIRFNQLQIGINRNIKSRSVKVRNSALLKTGIKMN